MNGKYVLDTNIVIGLFQADPTVKERLERSVEISIPSIVIGELYFGARKSGRVEDNLERVDRFAADSTVLACDSGTAQRYGEVKNALREKGRPLPENDIWIAAIALQHGLTLATRDAHFAEVEHLRTEFW